MLLTAKAEPVSCGLGAESLSVRLFENPYGLVSLWDIMQNFDAANFVDRIRVLHRIEVLLANSEGRQQLDLYMNNLESIERDCERLGLNGSAVQARRVHILWVQGQPYDTVREHVKHLLRQIEDDMLGVRFYYVLPDKAPYLHRQPRMALAATPEPIRLKMPFEYFGSGVIKRFMPIERDLREALKCCVYECRPACVFHLMRATEIGIPKLAKLCGIKDPKPSWGAVLDQAERLTQKTKLADLPPDTKPHIDFLREVVADMRSLQRAWRNKVMHVDDKLIPTGSDFDAQDVHDIFSATHSFLRCLAEGLPGWC
jgi:hypothetical protein